MNRVLLRGAQVITMAPNRPDTERADILIDGDTIAAVGGGLDGRPDRGRTRDERRGCLTGVADGPAPHRRPARRRRNPGQLTGLLNVAGLRLTDDELRQLTEASSVIR